MMAARSVAAWAALAARSVVMLAESYAPGHDPQLDRALARRTEMDNFLAQPRDRAVPFAEAVASLVSGWTS